MVSGRRDRPYSESLREYGRGLAGGLIFSLPLIYTMEVWWAGFIAEPPRLLVFIAAVFALLIGYNTYAGIRHDADWTDVVVDSVEEFGLGILTAAALMVLLARTTSHMGFEEIVGRIVIEAGVVAIGFSVGTAQLGADDGEAANRFSRTPGVMSQVVISLCGAVLVAANVAPTEEVMVIAAEVGVARLIIIIALSLLLSVLILFFSNFRQSHRFAKAETRWHAAAGGVTTYAVAVVASAALLWFFGRFDTVQMEMAVAQTVVLSLPATLGASAGRLLLQS